MNLSIYITESCVPVVLLSVSTVILLLFAYLRGRCLSLVAKYAEWQREAQAVEVATHDAMYREPTDKFGAQTKESVAYPRISIVMAVKNDGERLPYILPRYLGQQYAGDFEVIVADERSEDDSAEVVKGLQRTFDNLRYTFIPETSRHIEPGKLAVTLGIKAARAEWVIVVNAECEPISPDWLQHYSENLSPTLDFVTAYYNYDDDGSSYARHAILERVYAFNARLLAYEKESPIDTERANYAVRKEWFLRVGGFSDSLILPFGEEIMLAFHHAKTERTLLLCSPDTKLIEQLPPAATLRMLRVYRSETLRRLGGVVRLRRIKEHFITFLLYAYLILQILFVAVRTFTVLEAERYDMSALPIDLCWLLFLVFGVAFPIVLLRRSLRAVGERWYGGYIFLFELFLPFHRLSTELRRCSQRSGFVRRFI